ncbi:MAG: hypothetical protein ACETWK_10980 [Candidatus Aminicenantaceae bacterium]
MRKLILSLFCLYFGLNFLFSVYGDQEIKKLIDIEGLCSHGDDWKVITEKSSPSGGSIKLYQDKWLMYFVHWRPLTEEKENLSIDYMRKLMLSFWGPNMPFTLSDKGGEMRIAGHKAFYIDGTIYEGRIHTRFIVWNCPETKRQFIADCNINVGRGTPKELLALQEKISLTTVCHPGARGQEFPQLKQKYTSKEYKLSFFIPDNWRTNDYDPFEWFPEGMSDVNGSLWTLLTDSEKYVELVWDNMQKEITRNLFIDYIKRIKGSYFRTKSGTTWKIIDITIRKIEPKDEYIIGEGSFYYYLKKEDSEGIRPYLFKALLWENDGKTYFLLASLAALEKFWGRSVDLTPKREIIDRYLRDEVLPNVEVFNKSYE